MDRGGFAGAVGSEEADDFAAADVEGEAFDGGGVAECFVEIGDFDDAVVFGGGRAWVGRDHLVSIVDAEEAGGKDFGCLVLVPGCWLCR